MDQTIFLSFLVALFVTTISTPLCLIFIKKWGLFDDPKTHKHPAMLHKKPVPRGGGIPLFLGVLVAGIFFLPFNNVTISLLVASSLSLFIGVMDDKYDLSPYLRFGVNIVSALIVISSGVSVAFITSPFGGILHLDTIRFALPFLPIIIRLSDIVALVWIVWVMNMLNWSKGVDGQMPGIVAISGVVIGILSLRFTDPSSSILAARLSFIIAGSAIGFLFYNFYPARIFPGYGATAIYLLLSVVSILSGAKLATALLVMGVPLIDGTFTILRRILEGKSPFWHDKKHLHHLLLKKGFGQRRIAISYWLFSLILGTISLTLSSRGKHFAIVVLIVLLGGALLVLHYALRKDEKKDL